MQEVYENRTTLVIVLELYARVVCLDYLIGIRALGGELFEEIVNHGPYSERDTCMQRCLSLQVTNFSSEYCSANCESCGLLA